MANSKILKGEGGKKCMGLSSFIMHTTNYMPAAREKAAFGGKL